MPTATFAGVTFDVLAQDGGTTYPVWRQTINVSRRHIPYAQSDDVQFGGRSNYTLDVEAYLTADADLGTLQAAMDGTSRTLVYVNGTSYTGTRIIDMGAPRRWGSGQRLLVPVSFEREGS